jgi:UDP-N-acetyl-D-mannosaminuronic acid transferase (WecB/TagA/CpsF family)
MGILVALRLLHDSAIHFIFSLSFLHFFLVLLISHVFHFRTVCQKVKAENPNFSVLLGKNFLLLAQWEAEYINMLDSKFVLPRSTNVPVLFRHILSKPVFGFAKKL